jgi:hypothetical protein
MTSHHTYQNSSSLDGSQTRYLTNQVPANTMLPHPFPIFKASIAQDFILKGLSILEDETERVLPAQRLSGKSRMSSARNCRRIIIFIFINTSISIICIISIITTTIIMLIMVITRLALRVMGMSIVRSKIRVGKLLCRRNIIEGLEAKKHEDTTFNGVLGLSFIMGMDRIAMVSK